MWSIVTGDLLFRVDFLQETKSPAIASMCYSRRYMLYFVLSTDFKLHIYNGNLIRVSEVPLQTSLLRYCLFYDENSLFIAGGIDGVCVFEVQVNYKYSPMQALQLDPMGKLIKLGLEQ